MINLAGTYVPLTKLAADVLRVAAPSAHFLFVKTNGEWWAVGSNAAGQLGIGNILDAIDPQQVVLP